jgi:hypothetical protein
MRPSWMFVIDHVDRRPVEKQRDNSARYVGISESGSKRAAVPLGGRSRDSPATAVAAPAGPSQPQQVLGRPLRDSTYRDASELREEYWCQRCLRMRRDRAAFFSGAVRVLPRAALLLVSLLFVVALTGIEPVGCQSSSVQLSLSRYIFSPVQFATGAFRAVRRAGVVCLNGPSAREIP